MSRSVPRCVQSCWGSEEGLTNAWERLWPNLTWRGSVSLAQVPLQQQRAHSDQAGRAEEAEGENGGSAAEAGKVSGQRGGFLCCLSDECSETRDTRRERTDRTGFVLGSVFSKPNCLVLNTTEAGRAVNSAAGPVSLQVPAVRLRPHALPAARHAALRAGVRGCTDTAGATGASAGATCPGPAQQVSTGKRSGCSGTLRLSAERSLLAP